MGFLEYLLEERGEEEVIKELDRIRKLRGAIAKDLESLKNGYVTHEDGSRHYYWEYGIYTDQKRHAFKTKEAWNLNLINIIRDNQIDFMERLEMFKNDWDEYVRKTGDMSLSWNNALDLFPYDELMRDLDPDDEFLKEKYPELWLKGDVYKD